MARKRKRKPHNFRSLLENGNIEQVAPGTYKVMLSSIKGNKADWVIMDEVEPTVKRGPDVVWFDEASNINAADWKTTDYSKLENRILAWDLGGSADAKVHHTGYYYGGVVTGRWSFPGTHFSQTLPKGTAMRNIDSIGVVFNDRLSPTTPWSKGEKTYWYKTDIPGIKEGDTVVIDSPITNNSGMQCATVRRVYRNTVLDSCFKWVVDKVDTVGAANRRAAAEALAAKKAVLQSTINETNRAIQEREAIIRDEMIRQQLLSDQRYNALVGDLQDLAQQLQDLEAA